MILVCAVLWIATLLLLARVVLSWLEFFGVDPAARERGIGRRLTDALLAGFKKRGAHVARTMVRTQDAEIARFVAAMGFVPAPVSALEKRLA